MHASSRLVHSYYIWIVSGEFNSCSRVGLHQCGVYNHLPFRECRPWTKRLMHRGEMSEYRRRGHMRQRAHKAL